MSFETENMPIELINPSWGLDIDIEDEDTDQEVLQLIESDLHATISLRNSEMQIPTLNFSNTYVESTLTVGNYFLESYYGSVESESDDDYGHLRY